MSIDCCPHCGESKNGITWKMTAEFNYSTLWDDPRACESGEFHRVIRQTKFRCGDCGKVVPNPFKADS